MSDSVLELRGIYQAYVRRAVVRDLSLRLERGQIGCLLGPSGCGKTTVLRTVAGFEPILGGEILLNGKGISRPGWSLPPARRAVGMVFQDYALFPHLSIAANIAFGLREWPGEKRRARVDEMLELVGLEQERDRFPHEISGGQQQRVALARALAPQPNLLLMDEPFSNLDVALREKLSMEVRDILKDSGATALFVTHNQQEAFAVADRIGVMREGRMLQWGTAHDLYHRPACREVAGFIGEGALLRGLVDKDGRVMSGLGPVTCPGAELTAAPGTEVELLVRPEAVLHDDRASLQAEVVHSNFRGGSTLYTLRLPNGQHVQSLSPDRCRHQRSEKIGIRVDIPHPVIFPFSPDAEKTTDSPLPAKEFDSRPKLR